MLNMIGDSINIQQMMLIVSLKARYQEGGVVRFRQYDSSLLTRQLMIRSNTSFERSPMSTMRSKLL